MTRSNRAKAFLLLLGCLGGPVMSQTPAPTLVPSPQVNPAEVPQLFSGLEGRWSCVGAFASGKPLAADLTFTKSMDGRSLHYSHRDRAPGTYQQAATWGFDKASAQFASLAFSASAGPAPDAGLYLAESLSKNSVMLVHKRLFADPFAPNRFTYTVKGPNALHMLWEVQRKKGWVMGDYLNCERAASAKP